jgi:hypothetical protein
MIFLPDVNIWIALTSNRHVHHSLATEWLQGIENEQIAFCRISELSFLRLLTNAHVMGKDVLSPVEAWLVYDEWRTDDRVIFLPERANLVKSGDRWEGRLWEVRMSGLTHIWLFSRHTRTQRSSRWIANFHLLVRAQSNRSSSEAAPAILPAEPVL